MDHNIDSTLEQRGTRYGEFAGHAYISQRIKAAMRDSLNWQALTSDKKEALEMVAHKIARVLNGDPNYHDNWHDMIGYIRLIEKSLGEQKEAALKEEEAQQPTHGVSVLIESGGIDEARNKLIKDYEARMRKKISEDTGRRSIFPSEFVPLFPDTPERMQGGGND